MVDQEVADILAEIRNKVRATNTGLPETPPSTPGSTFDSIEIEPRLETNGFAGMTVLSRAWDRLPPLVTKRTGTLASLDLWVKRKIKSALRWITWEQVNFNAATHQTFIEVIDSLQQQKTYLAGLQERIIAEFEVTRNRLEEVESQHHLLETQQRQQNAFVTQLDLFNSQLASFNAIQSDLKARIISQNEQQLSLEALQTSHDDRIKSLEKRFLQLVNEFHELTGEFRGRDERIFDEQRVSLKQFSLELSESQVLQERARRELEIRLAKLEKSDK